MMNSIIKKSNRIFREKGAIALALTAAKKITPYPQVQWLSLIEDELQSEILSFVKYSDRVQLYRHGFMSQSQLIYDFEIYSPEKYLSDFQRYISAEKINGEMGEVLDNKLFFQSVIDGPLPTLLGVLKHDQFHRIDELPPSSSASIAETTEWIDQYIRSNGRIVLKYPYGGRGNKVKICSYEDGIYRMNGEQYSRREFNAILRDLEDYLVYEFVRQGEYINSIFPNTANTIRVPTMYDPHEEEPFIMAAVQRIGTDQSQGLDNWSQGGLSANIDLETGEMGPGIQFPYSGNLQEHEIHPSTGSQIKGVQVPGWERITEKLLEIADSVSFLPYIGWDILVTGPGEFVIIEGNRNTDVDLLQVHSPLLTNERVREFYDIYNVL